MTDLASTSENLLRRIINRQSNVQYKVEMANRQRRSGGTDRSEEIFRTMRGGTTEHAYIHVSQDLQYLERWGFKIWIYAGDGPGSGGSGGLTDGAVAALLQPTMGTHVGNGECYGLVSFYVFQVTNRQWAIGAGFPMNLPVIGGNTVNARDIAITYDWASIGWTIKFNPSPGDLVPGAIFTLVPPAWGSPVPFGHTGIIASVDGNNFRTYEQNVGGRFVTMQNRTWTSAINALIIPPPLGDNSDDPSDHTLPADPEVGEFHLAIEDIELTALLAEQFGGMWPNASGIFPSRQPDDWYDIMRVAGYLTNDEIQTIFSAGFKKVSIWGGNNYTVGLIPDLKFSNSNR